ncbi:MAG TPA: hypothetical protein GXZ93_04065 [Actinobacteria bacterium]|jgi:hypothetical protein|nr:hypothetical protein [Actinomycetota bacterium]
MFKLILKELKRHSPFTGLGALTGIIMLIFFINLPYKISYRVFYILHPLHVFLSAFVTSSMYLLHINEDKKRKIVSLILIGYFGSVGIASISDSVIPFLGEILLDMPNTGIHLGFIEEWWIVNPLAFLGIFIAYFKPSTRFPHAGHVLLSTWASAFHIIMSAGINIRWYLYIIIFLFLFIAVWIPCCASDIIFPLLFVKLKRRSGKSLIK